MQPYYFTLYQRTAEKSWLMHKRHLWHTCWPCSLTPQMQTARHKMAVIMNIFSGLTRCCFSLFFNQIINSVRSVHEYFASIPINRAHDISFLEDFFGGEGILRGLDSNCFHPLTNSSYMVCGASMLILLMLDWAAPSLLG